MQTTNTDNIGSYDGFMEGNKRTSPEIDIPKKSTRRVLAPSYKARILKEYDSLELKSKAALLRREGLYTSHISSWRKALGKDNEIKLDSSRGPVPKPEHSKIKSLEKENQRLAKELDKARRVIEIQGKLIERS